MLLFVRFKVNPFISSVFNSMSFINFDFTKFQGSINQEGRKRKEIRKKKGEGMGNNLFILFLVVFFMIFLFSPLLQAWDDINEIVLLLLSALDFQTKILSRLSPKFLVCFPVHLFSGEDSCRQGTSWSQANCRRKRKKAVC